MAITLLINPGSSSKKYSLVDDGRILVNMRFERDAKSVEFYTQKNGAEQKCEGVTFDQYETALHQVLDTALREKVIVNLEEIVHVGIRVVAPGTFFQSHRVIDELYLYKLRERELTAPLHIPHILQELEMLGRELSGVLVIGVSDSAFHTTMPDVARTYSIPHADTEQYDMYRFGYHGISNASILRRTEAVFGQKPARLIVCHIGGGVSMTAIRHNKSIDTTMGFSPSSGLIMGSRAGDIEPGAMLELMRVKNMKLFDTQKYIQMQGGLLGMADEADFRHILERLSQCDVAATAAMDLFVYHMQKSLGALTAVLGGLDAIVLTATAVERNATLRTLILNNLEWFGITVNEVANDALVGYDGLITTSESAVKVAVIRTQEFDEMLRVTHMFTNSV